MQKVFSIYISTNCPSILTRKGINLSNLRYKWYFNKNNTIKQQINNIYHMSLDIYVLKPKGPVSDATYENQIKIIQWYWWVELIPSHKAQDY